MRHGCGELRLEMVCVCVCVCVCALMSTVLDAFGS